MLYACILYYLTSAIIFIGQYLYLLELSLLTYDIKFTIALVKNRIVITCTFIITIIRPYNLIYD